MIGKKLNKTACKTRKTFKEALLKLFETKKIDVITVMDLHEATGYSRQTFYRHYKSIEDVYKDIITDMFKGFTEQDVPGKTVSLNEFICGFFHWIEKNIKTVDLFLNAGCETILIRMYYTLTLDVLEGILPKKDCSEAERTKEKLILLGVIMSMVYYWFETDFSDTPEQMATYIESRLVL
ncbi:MAG TPA: TetR/AcrR family transcriptional regulator [Thermotogota bacterium]|nr:TetR/AcrR family transcriptional regulator [Thermotogota bacterium]HPJ90120.1 TetR/AcrR family transcriptional regulator [Thermotogota bacterium]HPR96996.1 TetR/AcrR family transcriptional regulator [Thermotogota bacterium]